MYSVLDTDACSASIIVLSLFEDHADDDVCTQRKLRREEFIGLEKVVRLVFPPMSKSFYSRMHSKLMLLFHDTHLRIVVPSANPTK